MPLRIGPVFGAVVIAPTKAWHAPVGEWYPCARHGSRGEYAPPPTKSRFQHHRVPGSPSVWHPSAVIYTWEISAPAASNDYLRPR
ncbi:hypothetical protein B0H13DRAFT_2335542 [Mycena leptocephala]|nr:hypothetical protein B0H13DRAFT_2335542 [Mycena leptocephala]